MIVTLINGEGFAPDERLFSLFSPVRREKIAALRAPEVRAQSICAEMACMLCCQRALGFFPPYRIGFNGKPDLESEAHGHISLSHAGPYGMCAWSKNPVGADVESALRNLSRMSRRVRAVSDTIDDLNFLWCVKESYVKLTGEGLSRPFPSLTVGEGAVYDENHALLSPYQTGRLGDFLWCVCSASVEPVTLTVLSAANAQALLLA